MTAGPRDAGADFAATMLRRNRRLLDRALAAGGARYPIGTVPSRPADWPAHYGERWPRLVALKQRYDPAGILAPGHGVFPR
jgi:FAD/FMN-containing dehydrogenase